MANVLSFENFPLGCRFRPTQDELLEHYLRLQNEGRHDEVSCIAEIDIRQHEAEALPGLSNIKINNAKQWFFFYRPDPAFNQPWMSIRTPNGMWVVSSHERQIKSETRWDVTIGMKRNLLYRPRMTDIWGIHEYRQCTPEADARQGFVLGCVYKIDGEPEPIPDEAEILRSMTVAGPFDVFPPGLWFRPEEDEMIRYLTLRNTGTEIPCIAEVNLNQVEPWDVRERSTMKTNDQVWFCFSRPKRGLIYYNRKTPGGSWRESGQAKEIRSRTNPADVIAKRKTLVFSIGRGRCKKTRSNWIIHEYSPINQQPGGFVLNRLFNQGGNNNIVEDPDDKEVFEELAGILDLPPVPPIPIEQLRRPSEMGQASGKEIFDELANNLDLLPVPPIPIEQPRRPSEMGQASDERIIEELAGMLDLPPVPPIPIEQLGRPSEMGQASDEGIFEEIADILDLPLVPPIPIEQPRRPPEMGQASDEGIFEELAGILDLPPVPPIPVEQLGRPSEMGQASDREVFEELNDILDLSPTRPPIPIGQPRFFLGQHDQVSDAESSDEAEDKEAIYAAMFKDKLQISDDAATSSTST